MVLCTFVNDEKVCKREQQCMLNEIGTQRVVETCTKTSVGKICGWVAIITIKSRTFDREYKYFFVNYTVYHNHRYIFILYMCTNI